MFRVLRFARGSNDGNCIGQQRRATASWQLWLVWAIGQGVAATGFAAAPTDLPNIVYILADDI